MMHTTQSTCFALLVSLTIAVAACHRDTGPLVTLGAVTTVSAPTGVGTAPTFALAPNGARAMVWISAPDSGIDGRLYVSVNEQTPVMIVDPLAPIEVHSEAPPRLTYGADGALNVLYIVGKDVGKRFPVSALRFVRSMDQGHTWSAPVTVTDDTVDFGSHNFHSLSAAPGGTLYAAWLDGRDGHAATYFTYSTDGGHTWAHNQRLSVGETCPCCRTAITASADGVVYAAWRSVFPGNIRDIVVARSMNHGATWDAPVRVHMDNWQYAGCPHAGPSIQLDSTGRLHVLWWTGAPAHAGVFYTVSADSGRTFASAETIFAQQIPVPAHVQLAVAGPRVLAVWDAMQAHGAVVMVRASEDGGMQFGAETIVSDTGGSAQYPVVGLDQHTAYVAWSSSNVPSAHAHHKEGGGMPAKMGLTAVGATQVFMRRVVLQ